MIKYKTKRIEKEFLYDSFIKDKLKKIIYMVSLFCEIEFKEDITITELYRTQEEQESYYKNNKKFIEKPFKSVHQYGRGCDIRTRNIKDINKLVSFVNNLSYSNKHKTAIYHNIGMGNHLHLQSRT